MKICIKISDANDSVLLLRAEQLAETLSLPVLTEAQQAANVELLLLVTPDGLALHDPHDGSQPFSVDYSKLDISSHAGLRLGQPLAKALGIKRLADPRPRVIDATVGWGEDSYLMLAFGCSVLAIERNPTVSSLLQDGMQRTGTTHPDFIDRFSLLTGDACDLLSESSEVKSFEPDIVFLDPMYPGHDKRKTAERKPMKLLRAVVGEDADCDALLHAARSIARKRVIVKRPARAAHLAGEKPDIAFEGKAVRFDVYL